MPQGVIHKVTSVSSRTSGMSLKVTSMKQARTLILEIWRINSSDLSETVLQDYQELQFRVQPEALTFVTAQIPHLTGLQLLPLSVVERLSPPTLALRFCLVGMDSFKPSPEPTLAGAPFNFPLAPPFQPSHGVYSTQQPPQISASTRLMDSPFSHLLLERNPSPHRCVQGRIFVICFPSLPGSSPFASSLQSCAVDSPNTTHSAASKPLPFLSLPLQHSYSPVVLPCPLRFRVLFQCQSKRYFRRMLSEAAIAATRPSLLSVPLCIFPWDLSAATRQILYIHTCLICPPTRANGQ